MSEHGVIFEDCFFEASDPVIGYGIYLDPKAEAWRNFMRWVGLLSGAYVYTRWHRPWYSRKARRETWRAGQWRPRKVSR